MKITKTYRSFILSVLILHLDLANSLDIIDHKVDMDINILDNKLEKNMENKEKEENKINRTIQRAELHEAHEKIK